MSFQARPHFEYRKVESHHDYGHDEAHTEHEPGSIIVVNVLSVFSTSWS